MIHNLGDFALGATIYVPFHTFNSSGASVTLTGLAVTDIEVYKNGSMTQRASDAGFALLDTDGIDLDGITGIHGFSIDTSDNTTAGFYATACEYWIAVSAVTIDAQTVNFIAASFSIENRSASLRAGNIQGRIPAALSSGRIDSHVTSMSADAITASVIASGAFTSAKFASGAFDAVWSVAARILTAGTNIVLAKGTGLTGLNDIPTGSSMVLSSGERNSIADATLDRTDAIESGITVRGVLRLLGAVLAGKASGMSTTTGQFRNIGDTKTRITATQDSNGNRTAVTTDVT